MLFSDRQQAATLLADKLQAYRGHMPLVLAIPRGAVPMARTIAERLDGEMDVVLVRKLGAPGHGELAVGSVDESGWTYVAPFAADYGADAAYIDAEKKRQLETMAARRARYTGLRPAHDPVGRTVIVVDDGLATGATMMAALHALRARKPARLVCALPVAAPDSLKKVAHMADDVVCLHAPADFQAVGQFYASFPQVEDDEVVGILQGQ